jgi:hypothetical protein
MIPKLLRFSLKLLQSLPYFPLESLHIFGHLIFDIREGEGESSCLIIDLRQPDQTARGAAQRMAHPIYPGTDWTDHSNRGICDPKEE